MVIVTIILLSLYRGLLGNNSCYFDEVERGLTLHKTVCLNQDTSKDAIKDLMVAVSKKPDADVAEIAEEANLTLLSEDAVRDIIHEIAIQNESMIKERQMGAMGPLMGMCMKQLKGKVDGSLVNKVVREEIQKLI